MTQENSCIFCRGPLEEGDVCHWCGFSQSAKAEIPGTLGYGTKVDVYITGDVFTMDGESSSYFAYDTLNSRRVILKEFLPVSMVAPRDGNTVKVQQGKEVLFKNLMMDFTDLYNSLIKLDCKAIQHVYRVFSANGTAYAVLEYVKGDNLKQHLIKRGKPYTFKEARWLFQDVFTRMKKLEKANIAHGGISDETLIITPENTPILIGFAIGDLRVNNEHIIYKLYDGFSAPEQYEPNGFSGFYTDIFSVAVLFNYAVTGRAYTEGMFDTKGLDRHLPRHALAALRYATKPNPTQRIDNIEDFVLMLDDKAVVEKEKKPSKKQPDKKRSANPGKKYLPYVAVAAIMLVFGIAVMSLSGGEPQPPAVTPTPPVEIKDKIKVPDFRGESYNSIMNNREYSANFYFHIEEEYSTRYKKGQVITHSPIADEEVEQGTTIELIISKGRPMVTVPSGLEGMNIEDAKVILDGLGIKYTILEKIQTADYPHNTVQGTDKVPGSQMNPATDFLVVYISDATPVKNP